MPMIDPWLVFAERADSTFWPLRQPVLDFSQMFVSLDA
jgi:hypothetical protein